MGFPIRHIIVLLALLLSFSVQIELVAQEMEVTLIDDTLLIAEAHPIDPVIFHFDTFNNGEETIIVDIVKSDPDHPSDWDISICTVACLPPETDEAIFPIGGMLEEEVSIYFFPRSPGQGSVDVYMQSQSDSSETYSVRLFVDAIAPTDLEELQGHPSFVQAAEHLVLDLNAPAEVRIYDSRGFLMQKERLNSGRSNFSVSDLPPGVYVLVLEDNGPLPRTWRFVHH